MTKATILLVDDHPGIRDLLCHTMRMEGYDVTLVSNGQEAINSLRATGFDLVLLDLDGPFTNGWGTLSQIIMISLSLPLIVVTDGSDQPWLADQKGVAAVFEKPLNLALLLEGIGQALTQTTEVSPQRQASGQASFAPSSARGFGAIVGGCV
jgi:DNA-binding NtrC family response regulator